MKLLLHRFDSCCFTFWRLYL